MFQLNLKTNESCHNPLSLNNNLNSSRNYDILSQPSPSMRYKRFTQSSSQASQPQLSINQRSFRNILPLSKQNGKDLFNPYAGISQTQNLKEINEANQIQEKIQKKISLNLRTQPNSIEQSKSADLRSPVAKSKWNREKQNSDIPKIEKKSSYKEILGYKYLLEKQTLKAQELKDGKQIKTRNYYNKWYIPADKRFFPQIQEDQSIQDQILKQQNAYKQDPHLIYNQLKDSKIKYFNDPFDLVPSEEAMQLLSVKNKLHKFKDQFKNSKLLIKYIDQLQQSKERIPQFLQDVQFTFK